MTLQSRAPITRSVKLDSACSEFSDFAKISFPEKLEVFLFIKFQCGSCFLGIQFPNVASLKVFSHFVYCNFCSCQTVASIIIFALECQSIKAFQCSFFVEIILCFILSFWYLHKLSYFVRIYACKHFLVLLLNEKCWFMHIWFIQSGAILILSVTIKNKQYHQIFANFLEGFVVCRLLL